jgi:hypothetical protein
MLIPEYGRCPICDDAPVPITWTERGGMCVRCAQARECEPKFSEKSDELIKSLTGQLQNCVNHLEHAKRHTTSGDHVYDDAIEAANKRKTRDENRYVGDSQRDAVTNQLSPKGNRR